MTTFWKRLSLRVLAASAVVLLLSGALGTIRVAEWSGPGREDSTPRCRASDGAGAARPCLVVLIVVDQLRADVLTRYASAYAGGLRRLLDDGRLYPNARIDHAPSNSMPGHITLATGVHPRHHGIIDNGFIELDERGRPIGYVSAVADSTEKTLGAPALPGFSPRRLLVTGLADWVLRADSASRVLAISENELGALLHAGRGSERRQVYWYAPGNGHFVTSTFYTDTIVSWVQAFNVELDQSLPGDTVWSASVPRSVRRLARPDSAPYENGGHDRFPHRFAVERDPEWKPNLTSWLYFTPVADSIALELAARAVHETRIGQRGHVDFLSLALGSTDAIGHWFGPRSLEQLDNLLKLDRELGRFLEVLDRAVGRQNYVLVLSADHGTPDVPESPRSSGTGAAPSGTRVAQGRVDALFDTLAAAVTPAMSPDSARATVRSILLRQPFVAAVVTDAELADSLGAPADSFVRVLRNGYHPRRTPVPALTSPRGPPLFRYGLRVRLTPNTLIGTVPAYHGSPYDYDRRVALVLYGAGVEPGRDERPVLTVDVAPTLAALAGIPVPVPVDGSPLVSRAADRAP